MNPKKTSDPTSVDPSRRPARAPDESQGGRSAELRQGERLRGDTGGGPREDGVPNVPHGEHEER